LFICVCFLGDIPNIAKRIDLTKSTAIELKKLFSVLYPGAHVGHTKFVIKRNLRQFSGYTNKTDSEIALKKLETIEPNILKQIGGLLDISISGSKQQLIIRIHEFLLKPFASGGEFKAKVTATKRKSTSSKKKTTSKKSKKSKKNESTENDESDEEEEAEEESQEEEEASDSELETKPEPESTSSSSNSTLTPELCEQIKTSINDILNLSNLEEVTNKSILFQLTPHYGETFISEHKHHIKILIQQTFQQQQTK
jgi:hypothetical protein